MRKTPTWPTTDEVTSHHYIFSLYICTVFSSYARRKWLATNATAITITPVSPPQSPSPLPAPTITTWLPHYYHCNCRHYHHAITTTASPSSPQSFPLHDRYIYHHHASTITTTSHYHYHHHVISPAPPPQFQPSLNLHHFPSLHSAHTSSSPVTISSLALQPSLHPQVPHPHHFNQHHHTTLANH